MALAITGCAFESGPLPAPEDTPVGDPGAPPDPGTPQPEPDPGVTCSFTITAAKTYFPSSRSIPGKHSLAGTIEFAVPTELTVTQGNAGNHCAQLDVSTDNSTTKCIYLGGSSQSQPSPGTTQFDRGLVYDLVECRVGEDAGFNHCGLDSESGELITSDGLHLGSKYEVRIHNGASNMSMTEVQVPISGDVVSGSCAPAD